MADEEKSKPRTIDINDMQLVDEVVDVNPQADAFAGPPPPDDGDYRAKLSLGKGGVQRGGEGKGETPYNMVNTQAKIVAGPFENRVLFDLVSTMVMRGSGTSRMVAVLQTLGETVGSRVSINELTRNYTNRLAGEPEVNITSQWEAYCTDCKKVILRSQKRFPQDANGGHRHQLECPKCGTLVTAQARVVAYKTAPTA